MKKLTIGSAVYDDFEGVYFTYQSLRLNTQDIWDDLEFIIIDNNPESSEGKAVKHFCESTKQIRYIPYTEKLTTASRNQIFENSESKFCMSIDPHVLFEPQTIHKLIAFLKAHPETDDLYHGPMLYDLIKDHDPCSKMDPVWRDNMFGTWDYDDRGNNPYGLPFEIEMHGLGIFLCRTDAWLGFNKNFRGFGGEEGYIHKKFKQLGRKTICLPFLRWIHRFQRPRGVPYPLDVRDRIRNYIIGHKELGQPLDEIVEHFEKLHPSIDINLIIKEAESLNLETPSLSPTNKTQAWEKSEVDFKQPASMRYIAYELTKSTDDIFCLRHISLDSNAEINPSIHDFSSETPEHPALSILVDSDTYWSTSNNDKTTTKRLVIDLGEIETINKITTHPRTDSVLGLPLQFKILGSNNLIEWKELSNVDLLKS